MSRPRLMGTKKFGGCRDRDSSRLKNLEDVETEIHRDSPKGVKTETESQSGFLWKPVCIAEVSCKPVSQIDSAYQHK